jgi:hypothetical protein
MKPAKLLDRMVVAAAKLTSAAAASRRGAHRVRLSGT